MIAPGGTSGLLSHGRPCSNATGEELDVEPPRGAIVDRHLATPAKAFLRDLRKAPTDRITFGALAELHDVAAFTAADHAEVGLCHGIGPLDLPGIDSGIIDPQRGAINVDVGRRVALALGAARRDDPYVLDRASFEHPAEMPLAVPPALGTVGQEARDVEVPGADQPAVEGHVAGAVRRG